MALSSGNQIPNSRKSGRDHSGTHFALILMDNSGVAPSHSGAGAKGDGPDP